MTDPATLRAALAYAARGWHVFPLVPNDKVPITQAGFKDAVTDEAQIRAWWTSYPTANVGIAAGASGLVILDVDGEKGDASLTAWTLDNGPLPITPVAYTPGGGRHFLFAAEGSGIGPNQSVLGPDSHVDVRAGGSYIVAPPSIHPNGGTYEWDADAHPARVQPHKLPAALLARLERPREAVQDLDDTSLVQPGEQDAYGAVWAAKHARAGMTKDMARAALGAMIEHSFVGGWAGADTRNPWTSADVERWIKGAYEKFESDGPDIFEAARQKALEPKKFETKDLAPDDERTSWDRVDLQPFLDGKAEPDPSMLRRSDDVRLLYDGKLHWLSGEPEGLKSWLAQIAVADAVMEGLDAVYIDFEDGPAAVVARLLALGVSPTAIRNHFAYYRPETAMEDDTANRAARVGRILADVKARPPRIAVIDGVNAAMGTSGLDSNKAGDFYKWWAALGAPLRKAMTGPVIAIDHVVKNAENRGQYAAGTGQKLAAVDVHYGIDIVEPFGIGMTGRANIRLHKDRPGRVRPKGGKWVPGKGSPIGKLVMVSSPDGLEIRFVIEAVEAGSTAEFRPTAIMERVSRFMESVTAPLSKTAIKAGAGGKATTTTVAIDVLAHEGYLGATTDAKGYAVYLTVKPYRQSADLALTGASDPGALRRAGGPQSAVE